MPEENKIFKSIFSMSMANSTFFKHLNALQTCFWLISYEKMTIKVSEFRIILLVKCINSPNLGYIFGYDMRRLVPASV